MLQHPEINLKRRYSYTHTHTHTHSHLFWSQSLHCSREAKTVSMKSEWRGCCNDRNEECTWHLTCFFLSVESSRKRNTLEPSFYIPAPWKTTRKWLNFLFLGGEGRKPYPLAARRSILWTFCNDFRSVNRRMVALKMKKNNSPLFVFVCLFFRRDPWITL